MMPTTIDEFRDRLAQVDDPQDLDAICLGAVFTGGLADHEDEVIGTVLSLTQRLGMGFFGPTVYTYVKLCPACVHKPGDDGCLTAEQAEEFMVTYVEHVRRNGDCCVGDDYCDLHSSPLVAATSGTSTTEGES